MDIEVENVLKLIFPNEVPDNWKENPDVVLYLSKLGSFHVEQLIKEPERLNEEKSAVLEQTQELAFSNYKTFIQTAECSREIFKQFGHVEHHLDALKTKLPEFSHKCQEFGQKSSNINAHRRLNSLTLTRNAQLLEVLELPQLMETCIRNGSYEEALELAAYVRRLGRKHGHIPIIAGIVKEVEAAWLAMLHQLLAQLRTDLQLPRCLAVVGYLRRMGIFSEAELRLKFLQARDSWLQGLLASIPKDDASQHLNKTIELTRIHLFNIVTQFRAIFSDEEPILPSPRDQNVNETAIFYSWITEKIHNFLNTLERDVDRANTSLDSVLGQCMYFGLSFSRVGADFRGLLAPVFIKTVTQNFEKAVRKANKKFEQDMESFTVSKTPSNVRTSPSPTTGKQDHPPESLIEFYPLAEYCNGLLSALNELRLCAPIAVANSITKCLQESLSSAVKTILGYHKQEQGTLLPAERETFSRFCCCLTEDLFPHLQRCLHAIFPPATLATHLGVSVQQIQKEGLTFLDRMAVVEPIRHLLPLRVSSTSVTQKLLTTAGSEETENIIEKSTETQDDDSSSVPDTTPTDVAQETTGSIQQNDDEKKT
ncbi:conserved oligomeric Golgi complex subunit 8 [Schistocerca americana]|uniref:conserved oligomeric Golgi complex subunit 8 n=1 Tax=Schistocerca americana TaxID=7009 RepID=UPI001F4FE00C|nr:conserved oligomeric Golgi complex subunit 8 [Schistocerca americana]